jgi:thiol-disulfide isomerase/thioredoxin
VHELAQSEQDEIDNMLALIKNASNKVVFVREEKEEKPQSIDRLLLERYLKPLKNERIENKTVFLDFFYQGCYPCVKSYPYVNDLYKNKKPDVVVIGVDRLLQDSITIDRYIEKYNLQYPILTGEQALLLANFFKIHGDPTFIVIAPNGKIVEHKLGFTKGSFKSFAKTLTK